MRADERGAVLVVAVLMALALFAMAHGLLLSARHAVGAARTGASLVELRAAADRAVDRARSEGIGRWADSVATGERRIALDTVPGGARTRATWRRLDREVWLLGVTVERERSSGVTSERLLWALDPLQRLLEMPGALAVGPGATVSVAGMLHAQGAGAERDAADPTLRALCDRWWDARLAVSADFAEAVTVTDAPSLGLLDLDRLLAIAPALPDAAGTPAPGEVAARCDAADAWNWGDPDRPWRPCGTHFVLRAGSASTTVAGGVGQGVLVVDGDLELTASARYYGIVIVSGRLLVTDGALLEGHAAAAGGADIAADAAVVRSVCRAALALDGVRDEVGPGVWLHTAPRFGPRGPAP